MKFLGQYIQSFIARFRSDVYLEDVASGTIASGGNLGLDSNNKIVKANEPTSHDAVTLAGTPDYITLSGQEITRNAIDLTADVTGTLPVNKGGTGAVSLTDNAVLTGTSSSPITAESTLSYTSETLSIGADDNGEAIITRLAHGDDIGGDLSIKAGDGTGANRLGGDLNLYGGTSTGAAGGGKIAFFASPGGGASGSTASTQTEVGSISNAGNLQIDGGMTVGSTSFVNSSGVVQVATQGTIDHDSLANFVAAEHYRWDNDISGTATIHANNVPSVATTHATAQTGKNYRIINTSFRQDIGTTKYYLPFKSQDENVTVHREEVSELAVCDGRVVSVTLRVENLNTHSGDANVTFGVTTNVVGAAYATFTEQETEVLAINDGDDHHLFHYVFSDAKHWDSTDMFAISIQSDTDISGGSERFYITVVIEDDWNTYLAGSSREIDSTP